MLSALLRKCGLVFLLLCAAMELRAQINPHTQIRWPAGCGLGSGKVYNLTNNTCIDMNQINPGTQITWPTCAPGQVYVPSGNQCITNGTANNPAGSNTQVQFNAGGTFGADPSFTYNSVTHTLGAPNMVAAALPSGFAGAGCAGDSLCFGRSTSN